MIGAGKTTLALAISHFMNSGNRMIYCCTNDTVRMQIAKMAYHSGIKFAMGSLGIVKYKHKNLDQFNREYRAVNEEI